MLSNLLSELRGTSKPGEKINILQTHDSTHGYVKVK